ncbi:histidine phosphatase family protein [Candidatus Uhrbacteria bacterium CG10_big_fil_rev_8_21_14_0_10_48_11]|uniref:Histidine phosphatase family protein n=1 Tax=Candidatus Uhrbacteria bacterium CG10_big_fil_rev_8_21_14_0_10_48_11 TaxID=1975037 RepID=A0A2M8LEP0_9BACT|nr:MAG: histidine phosphatase family protein [Candidatus Uhrbacteria bacterium CG10_big_fil_rev_8_21_14_0_10_48_11]
MRTILFAAHATSTDNEAGISSGWSDAPLSPLGEQRARELGERYKGVPLRAVYCSELQRSYQTGPLAFGDVSAVSLLCDQRLIECNYGDFTGYPSGEVEAQRAQRITTPFPNGESYNECVARMKNFLVELQGRHEKGDILIIGHRATQFGLEYLLNHRPLEVVVNEPFHWQPEWRYQLPEQFA